MRKHAKATLAKHKLLEAILWETFFDMVRIVIRMDCRRFRGENEAVKSSSAIERADSLLVSFLVDRTSSLCRALQIRTPKCLISNPNSTYFSAIHSLFRPSWSD